MKVYLIDDHRLFRDGMSVLLASKGIEAICTDDPEEGLKELKTLKVDAILLDLRMGQYSGIDVLKDIKLQKITPPVIILTTSNNERDLKYCLQAGAQGYLLKDMNPDELIEALTDATKGAIVVDKSLLSMLKKFLAGELQEEVRVDISILSKREKEVACSLINGSSNKIIARELGISEGTVKLHIKSILKKLELNSRVEIAVLMSQNHYCE